MHGWLVFLLLISPFTLASSTVYKIVDKKTGHVTYTDSAGGSDAQPIILNEPTIMTPPRVIQSSKPTANTKMIETETDTRNIGGTTVITPGYSNLNITSPRHNETFWNPEVLPVVVSLEPELQRGHKFRIKLDGDTVAQGSKYAFFVQDVPRGAHTVTVELMDNRGKMLRAASMSFFVHRKSILHGKDDGNGEGSSKE